MEAKSNCKNSKWSSIFAAVSGLAPFIDHAAGLGLLPPWLTAILMGLGVTLSTLGGQQAACAAKKL